MSYDPQNVFARILRGELPCTKICEDRATLAIMDIMPQADGHSLVITREPAETIFDLSPEAAAACIVTTQRIARAAQKALRAPGILISQINGSAAGQSVPHVHFHIIPRWPGVPLKRHGSERADPSRIEEYARRIIAALQRIQKTEDRRQKGDLSAVNCPLSTPFVGLAGRIGRGTCEREDGQRSGMPRVNCLRKA